MLGVNGMVKDRDREMDLDEAMADLEKDRAARAARRSTEVGRGGGDGGGRGGGGGGGRAPGGSSLASEDELLVDEVDVDEQEAALERELGLLPRRERLALRAQEKLESNQSIPSDATASHVPILYHAAVLI